MTFKQHLYVWAVTLMLACATFGCASQPVNVIGNCYVPAQYDVVKTGPDKLTKVDPKGHAAEEAHQRHKHHMDAEDYNAFLAYVKANCQH